MKNVLLMLMVCWLTITACNDNSDSPFYAPMHIKGTAAMGYELSGEVTVYDYSNCEKGDVLNAQTLNEDGGFGFELNPAQFELPVLVELTRFTYKEEATGVEVDANGHTLRSVAVLSSGASDNVVVSYWTQLAAARTAHLCSKSADNVIDYIGQSNDILSDALGFDINTTQPKAIESFVMRAGTNNKAEVQYGVANAAVSYYTKTFQQGDEIHSSMHSAAFATVAYKDLSFEGFLNGTGPSGQMVFGDVNLNLETYRTTLAKHMDNIFTEIAVGSGIDKADISGSAERYYAGKLDIFGNVEDDGLGDETPPLVAAKYVVMCETEEFKGSTVPINSNTATYSTVEVEFDVDEPDSRYDVTASFVCDEANFCCDSQKEDMCAMRLDQLELVNPSISPFVQNKPGLIIRFTSEYSTEGRGYYGVPTRRIKMNFSNAWGGSTDIEMVVGGRSFRNADCSVN